MTLFFTAVDDACDEQAAALKRSLNSDETRLIEDKLFVDWLKAGRYDDLIDHALNEYDLQDGVAFCASLGEALAKAGDHGRFERLFLGLAKTRESSFWRTWPRAKEGHIGAMKETSRHLANALDSLAGLYHCYWVTNDSSGMESVKAQMLRLQARQRPSRTKSET